MRRDKAKSRQASEGVSPNRPSNGRDAIRERPWMANSVSVRGKGVTGGSTPFFKAKKSRYFNRIGFVLVKQKASLFFLCFRVWHVCDAAFE